MSVPQELKYTKDHEWVSIDGDVATIGITDHAQSELSDVVFIDLPAVGREVSLGDAIAVAESVKAASDIYSPLSGEIVEVNEDLTSEPGKVNSEPYTGGWMFRVKISRPEELSDLMDADSYAGLIG